MQERSKPQQDKTRHEEDLLINFNLSFEQRVSVYNVLLIIILQRFSCFNKKKLNFFVFNICVNYNI